MSQENRKLSLAEKKEMALEIVDPKQHGFAAMMFDVGAKAVLTCYDEPETLKALAREAGVIEDA